MTDKKSHEPIDLNSDDTNENSRLHAATSIQSPVTPDQYPEEERQAQVEAATGKPAPNKSYPENDKH